MDIYSQLVRAQLENRTTDPSSPRNGLAYYDTNLGKIKVYNESAVSWDIIPFELAYIENGGAESSLNGWATYLDAAAASPVDGTGGTANVVLSRETAAPLRGGASFLLTKDAVDRQGEGASYDFVIDSADQGESLTLEFDYLTGGTFVVGGSSDVLIYLYDITNAGFIALSTNTIDAASGRFMATFTAAVNSQNYRLIYHVATTSAAAWTLKYDRVSVSLNAPVSQAVSAVPVATVMDYAGSAAPAGYLMCDGSDVSRSTYAALFATVGTTFGEGDTTTTFGLPDLRGRATIGKDDMGGNFPADVISHVNFEDLNYDLDIAGGVATAAVSGTVVNALIEGSQRARISGSSNISYDAPSNYNKDLICFATWYRFDTGAAPQTQNILRIDGTHPVNVTYVPATNDFSLIVVHSGGTVFQSSLGGGTLTLGVSSWIEVYADIVAGDYYFFVDGVSIYTATGLTSGTRAENPSDKLVFANGAGVGLGGQSTWDDATFYSAIQNTINHPVPSKASTELGGTTPANRVTTGESGIDGITLGSSGGTEAYALTESELASHDHTFTTGQNSGSHSHTLDNGVTPYNEVGATLSGTGTTVLAAQATGYQTSNQSPAGNHTHDGRTATTGVGDTHQNMPPSLIMNKIIKT